MVKVGFREKEIEYPNGASIAEKQGLLFIYGPEPDMKLIALHQTWDHAEVVEPASEEGD